MSQSILPFKYHGEKKDSGLTGFSGVPLYLELAIQSGLVEAIHSTLNVKSRGWSDAELILSLILLNLVGGDCISDIDRLEHDSGLRALLLRFATHGMNKKERQTYEKRFRKSTSRAFPSNASIHRFLPQFHSVEEEETRAHGKAFIPSQNENLKALIGLNKSLVESCQLQSPSSVATLDQDATLTSTHKRKALYCYKGFKSYQPLNTYWAEHDIILHSEFRDGNVNAGFEQLRILQESLALLPSDVNEVHLRSDSAGYQEELLRYCAEGSNSRFGVIEFVIAAKVTEGIRKEAKSIAPARWQPIYQEDEDGNKIKTHQEYAEICFVPDWTIKSKGKYRYLVIREAMEPLKEGKDANELPFQTMNADEKTYKLFAIVTNRDMDGSSLIQWHRKRCGKSEQAHNTQKDGLAGGQFPSNLFGANAAWWAIMVLSFNLSRLMQITALPKALKQSKMKALRFHLINLPGRVIYHARQVYIRVESHCCELFKQIRSKIFKMVYMPKVSHVDSS